MYTHRPRKGRKCTVEGCDGHHMAKGYCSSHWAKWKKYGDPLEDRAKDHIKPEEKKELLADYAAGVRMEDIARKLGKKPQSIRNTASKAGVSRPPSGQGRRTSEERSLEIARLYMTGLSSPEVARKMGCATTTVISCVRRHGFDVRPPHRLTKRDQSSD